MWPRSCCASASASSTSRAARAGGGPQAHGGGGGAGPPRTLEPTIALNPPAAHALPQGELFGPILPVVTVSGVDDAIAPIAARPEPLSVYVFTDDAAVADQ